MKIGDRVLVDLYDKYWIGTVFGFTQSREDPKLIYVKVQIDNRKSVKTCHPYFVTRILSEGDI